MGYVAPCGARGWNTFKGKKKVYSVNKSSERLGTSKDPISYQVELKQESGSSTCVFRGP